MTARLDTKGHRPLVEYRPAVDRYFILYESLGVELAPAFKSRHTAYEIAVNSYHGEPFFMMIPTVPIGTAFPRPNMLMPKVRPVDVGFRIA